MTEGSIRRGFVSRNVILAPSTRPPDGQTLRFHLISQLIETREEWGIIEVMRDFLQYC